MKKVTILLGFIFPTLLFAQSSLFSDSDSAKKVLARCHDAFFVRSEEIPSLKISKLAFQDSLMSQLKSNDVSIPNGTIKYKFLVTIQSEILDMTIVSGDVVKEKKLRKSVMALSSLWNPGKQNSHVVCAYATLEITFSAESLIVNISQ